jgi:hypothetical protein
MTPHYFYKEFHNYSKNMPFMIENLKDVLVFFTFNFIRVIIYIVHLMNAKNTTQQKDEHGEEGLCYRVCKRQ